MQTEPQERHNSKREVEDKNSAENRRKLKSRREARDKKAVLTLAIIAVCAVSIAVVGSKTEQQKNPTPKEETRETREQRRAQRQEQREKAVDSLVIARTWQINPQTMQMLPAGPMRSIMNPNFTLGVWDDHADVFLPYVTGVVPPHNQTILNYTINSLENYSATRTDQGWLILFESQLFSASTYTFETEIDAKFGTATLTITNPWQNAIQYTGTISKFY